MILDLIYHPNDLLLEKSLPVMKIDDSIKQLAKDMMETMVHYNGLGLSAIQVGVKLNIIIVTNKIMINPVLLQLGRTLVFNNEGCLSFPNKFVKIRRPSDVKVKYQDLNGKTQFSHLKGIQAQCFLHEYDHLQGKLYDDGV